MRMSFLGAAHMVTGSCYLIETNDKKFLVDCGMFQGAKRIRELNYEEFPFSPAELDCVVLTHEDHAAGLCLHTAVGCGDAEPQGPAPGGCPD